MNQAIENYMKNSPKPLFDATLKEEYFKSNSYNLIPKKYIDFLENSRELNHFEKSLLQPLETMFFSMYNLKVNDNFYYSPEYNRYFYNNDYVFDIGDNLQLFFKSNSNISLVLQHYATLHNLEIAVKNSIKDKFLSVIIALHGSKKKSLGLPFPSQANTIKTEHLPLELFALEKFLILKDTKFKNIHFTKEELYALWVETFVLSELPSDLFMDSFKATFSPTLKSVMQRKSLLRQFADENGFLEIYRGVTHKDGIKLGFSWSLSEKIAENFAKRYKDTANEGYIVKGKIHIDDIYDTTINNGFLGVEELEVLCNAEKIILINN